MRPRLLDLFCGAGGAAMGYHRAGFDVVGVDVKPQPRYPFEFVQADALEWLARPMTVEAWEFDAIHASPPCQLFSAYQRANKHQGDHLNLIPQTRELLLETGLPYVIENVEGAPLEEPTMICGSSVGIDVRRHRLFETNFPLIVPSCVHGWQTPRFNRGSRDTRPNDRSTVAVGEWRLPVDLQRQAMEIDWMTVPELSQAIPPAYTELIGHQLMQHIKVAA